MTYTGAKKQIITPTNCVPANSVDATGAGTITYSCSWANAANATGSLNFTAVGKIAGELHAGCKLDLTLESCS